MEYFILHLTLGTSANTDKLQHLRNTATCLLYFKNGSYELRGVLVLFGGTLIFETALIFNASSLCML